MKKINRLSQKAIIINKEGKILALRRTKTAPSRSLFWDLPGGDLEFGENTESGIIREIKEETGLEVEELKLHDVFSSYNDIKEFWITICYKVKTNSADINLSFEHDQYKWVSKEEFLKLKVSPKNKRFVRKL